MATCFLENANADAFLTDGEYRVSYSQIPEYIQQLERDLTDLEIVPFETVALVCEQSVATVLVLVCLLERHQRLVLLPAGCTPEGLPEFFRFLLTATLQDTGSGLESVTLERQANPQFRADPSSEPGKIYMKTSGSTGLAKLAIHDRDNLLKNARNVGARLQIVGSDRVALPVPIHHLYGFGAALLPCLAVGASIDLQAGANLMRFLKREKIFDPTTTYLTPSFARTLLRGRRKPRPYRLTVMAGDKLPKETFDRYSDLMGTVVQVYGSTEMGAMAATSPEDPVGIRVATVGTPLDGVDFRLEKETGQLLCRHQYGFESYADESGNTIERPDWFPTRDHATLDSEGRVQILGRSDHRINRDGLLVSMPRVEAALLEISQVAHVAVVPGVANERGTVLVAFCVAVKGQDASEIVLRELAFERLPRRAVPDHIILVPSLPELQSGKLDRHTLQQHARELS